MQNIKPEPIAENGDRCFVCSQGHITPRVIEKIFIDKKEMTCRYCGAVHVADYDGTDDCKKIFVKRINK